MPQLWLPSSNQSMRSLEGSPRSKTRSRESASRVDKVISKVFYHAQRCFLSN